MHTILKNKNKVDLITKNAGFSKKKGKQMWKEFFARKKDKKNLPSFHLHVTLDRIPTWQHRKSKKNVFQ